MTPRLLVVEDDIELRASIAQLLSMEGFDVDQAEDGAGALRAVEAARPDLVLLDIGLPDQDGWRVRRDLGARPNMTDVPIVALTGLAGDTYKGTALETLEFADYLEKPVGADDLLRCVREKLDPTYAGA